MQSYAVAGRLACALIAIASWFYGVYAIIHARRNHIGGRDFQWSELTTWRELTPVGRRWLWRYTAAIIMFALSVLLASRITR